MKQLISLVLPVFNEEETLDVLYESLQVLLDQISRRRYRVEVLFINDGSSDRSMEKLIGYHHHDKRVKLVSFSRNFGQQMAVTAGLDIAQGDAVIIMDSDMQDPPEVSLKLIEKWEEGYDVVYAQRKTRKDSPFKKITSHFFYRVLDKLADIRIPKDTGDFRLMDKKVVHALRKFREHNRFMRGLVSYVGFKQTAILFERHERYAGVTKYPLKKMVKLAIDGITGFSTIPLRVITHFGFFVSLLSFLGIVYALLLRVFFPDITVSGWTMLIISVLFIGGVQMVMLGILGSYIGRIYTEIRHRPLYIVESVYSE
ncbi:MAG: glycosyltransferase family 2 protein [Candidatus Dojkabacteria bacterium]